MNNPRCRGTCVSLCVLFGCVLLSADTALAQGSKMTSEGAAIAEPDRDNPAAREQWFRKGRTAPAGQSAAEMRYRAHQQKLRMRAMRAQTAAAQVPAAPNAMSTGWTALGPVSLASNPGNGQDYSWVSGRATSVVIDPTDTTGNTVYLGGGFGGLWRSTNAASGSFGNASGVTWTPLIDNQPTLAVGAIALQPGNATNSLSNVILVGTGEANSSGDSYYGLGILRSTDAGNNWSLISTANSGTYSFKGLSFSKIAFSTSSPSLVVAGVASTFPGEQEGADNLSVPRGVYSSRDAGATWTLANVQGPGGTVTSASASAVVYNASAGLFYAAIRRHGFFSSSDGVNWSRLPNQPGGTLLSSSSCPESMNSTTCPIYRGEFAVVPGRNEMYVWFVDVTATGEVNRGIWQTKDGGSDWTQISTTTIDACGDPGSDGCGVQQGVYNLELAAVPNGSTGTDLYAGAINLFKCSINSANPTCGTKPFMNLTHVYGCLEIAHVHPDQHGVDSMVVGGKDILYFANDGGIYRALDGFTGLTTGACGGTNNFDSLNQTIGSMTEFVSFSQDSGNPAVLLGGTQDNGSPATNQATTSTSWISVNNGDGGYNEINPSNPTEWFTANTDVTIQRCTSGINCAAGTFNLVVSAPQVGGDVGPFYTPYMLDPQATSEMLVGTCRLWRGTSLGTNFLAYSFNFETGTLATCNGSEVNQVRSLAAGGPQDANGISKVIYVGTDGAGPVIPAPVTGGHVFVTSNANGGPAVWQDTTGNINGNGYPVSSIAIDSSDNTGATAYITIMGFTGSPGTFHVFKTTDAGQTWTDFSTGLPDAPANSIVVDAGPTPENGTLYVGTDVGVFSSPTLSANWTEVGPAPAPGASGFIPNVPVTKLRIFNSGGQKLLRASTYGRGVWQFPISVTPDYAMAVDKLQVFSFPNQTTAFTGNLFGLFGYSNSVALSCGTGAPPSCTAPPIGVIPSSGGTAFAINVSGPAVADYSFNIHGIGTDTNSTTHDLPVAFHVVDFSIYSVQPTTVTGIQGSESQPSSISMVGDGQFSEPVNFSCDPASLPPGATCYFAPNPLILNGNTVLVSNFTLGTTSATPLGSYNVITVINSAGAPSPKMTAVTVTVLSGKDYNVALGSQGSTVPGGSATFPITLSSAGSYSGTVSLGCDTFPAVTEFTCSVAPFTVSLSSGQNASATGTVQATANVQPGVYRVRVFTSDATAGLSHSLDTSVAVVDFQFVPTNGVAMVTAGQTATYTLAITPLGPGGFTNSISMACSGLPASATCSFSPSTVTPGATATTVTLNISTKTRLAYLRPLRHFYALALPLAGLLLIFGGVLVEGSRRSKVLLAAAFTTILGLSLSLIACGGGSSGNNIPPPPPPPQGTPAGSYSVTVTASSGPLAHNTSVSLAVQ